MSSSASLWQNRIRTVVVAVGVSAVVLCLGIMAYAHRLRINADSLVASAREIRGTEDAKLTIEAWTNRSGEKFWIESDGPGGDHNYDAQVNNLPLARFRIVQPTSVGVAVTLRGGELRSVTVTETTGWYPLAAVWIQEWFDDPSRKRFRVSSKGKPSTAAVEFSSSVAEPERVAPFSLNTGCLVRPTGCKTADEMLPDVWSLQNVPPTPD